MAVALKIKESIASSSWIRKMFEEGMRLKQIHGADNVFDFSIGNPDAQPPKKFFSLLKRFAKKLFRVRAAICLTPDLPM